jgi:hypothetical protein
MYLLRNKKIRFLQISNAAITHYDFNETNQLKKFIVATGLLNHVWQSWNQFWRAYWLAHLMGGKDLQNNKITPIQPHLSESQALYYLLTLIGKRKRGSTGEVNFSYQEATWGDLKTIQDIAICLSSPSNNIINTLNAASLFGMNIDHFQIIRNSQTHISTSNMKKLSLVTPYYIIALNLKYPHDILEAKELSSGKIAIRAWIENMNDFLAYL